ncbi:MAG: PorP/SprF family type IX secretion system membrane protein [Saprospiraceae bacterium]
MTCFRKIINISKWLILVLGFSSIVSAQDPFFSQFYAAPLQLNSAFTGLSNGTQIGVNYRNQWPLIDQAFKTYVTYNIFYNQFFPKVKSGFGMELTSDVAGGGFIRTNKANLLYGYKIPINRHGHVIKGGLELGYVLMNYNWDKFIFGDQIDPVSGYQTGGGAIISKELVPSDKTSNYIDIGMGVLYYSPKYYIGASVKHLNSPDIGILNKSRDGGSGLPPRIGSHGGFEFDLSGNNKKKTQLFSPSIAIVSQASFFQLNIGGQYLYKSIFTGLFFRQSRKTSDALIFNVGFKKDYWKLGYSFDFTLSKLSISEGGSHEISLLFNFEKDPRKTSNVSDCFEAFR